MLNRHAHRTASIAAVALFIAGCGGQSPAPVQDANPIQKEDPEARFAANATPLDDGESGSFQVLDTPPQTVYGSTPSAEPAPGEGGVATLEPAPGATGYAGAADALLAEADGHRAAGSSEREAASLERALQVAPDDGRVWLALARTRLRQGRYAEAEGLAKRSLALTEGDASLQADGWRVIAEARDGIGDPAGAAAARDTASRLGGLSG